MLMPCFKPGEARCEGIVLGRLLAGYGELEVTMLQCVIAVNYLVDTPVRDLFAKRGEHQRIEKAKTLLTADFAKAGLLPDLNETLDDMHWCRDIRNQYAHCQWYFTTDEGLCFVDLEALAKSPNLILDVTVGRQRIDVPLLEAQETFFNYVKESFVHLASAYKAWDRKQTGANKPIHVFAKPTKVTRPSLHN